MSATSLFGGWFQQAQARGPLELDREWRQGNKECNAEEVTTCTPEAQSFWEYTPQNNPLEWWRKRGIYPLTAVRHWLQIVPGSLNPWLIQAEHSHTEHPSPAEETLWTNGVAGPSDKKLSAWIESVP